MSNLGIKTVPALPVGVTTRSPVFTINPSCDMSHSKSKRLLSEQQYRVAVLAQNGWSNKEIAAELSLSRRTVDFYLTIAYRKLGIKRRTELLLVNLEHVSTN